MSTTKQKRFTEQSIERLNYDHLKAPPSGKMEIRDDVVRGLLLRVTPRGVKSFSVIYKVPGEGGVSRTGRLLTGKQHRIATNDQHPINIDTGDRRYYPLHVNPACAKNKPYFAAIIEQMREGGRAALLDFLLKRDVSDFNAEKMPWTKELQLQKNMSVNEKDALIIDWANYGHLPGALERMPWVARSGELLRAMREGGGRELKLMSDQKLADVLKSWGFQRHSLKTGGGWRAPPLAQMQAEIGRRFPGTVWDHPEIVAWAGLTDAQEESKGRTKDDHERAAKAQKAMELQAQKRL